MDIIKNIKRGYTKASYSYIAILLSALFITGIMVTFLVFILWDPNNIALRALLILLPPLPIFYYIIGRTHTDKD